MPDNPFEVLKLPPTATAEEIVRQGAVESERAPCSRFQSFNPVPAHRSHQSVR